jgi:Uma2 family endonuclease
MHLAINQLDLDIDYPDGDGRPMTESDPTRDYLIYCIEALSIFFQNQPDVYVSGNLFIYYKKGVRDAVLSPDVFVVFGVEKKKRRSYKVWEEGGKVPGFILEVTSKTTQENDETEKPQKYQNMGVLEYFQYDPTADYLQPQLKGFRLVEAQYQPLVPQVLEAGNFSIYSETLGLDLCLINGQLRFYNPRTNQKLLTYAEIEQSRRAAVPKLLSMGLSQEQVAEALNLSIAEVSQVITQQEDSSINP